MLVEDVKDLYYDSVVLLLGLATEDEDVVKVDDHNSFINKLLEDVIHHYLEISRLLVISKNMTRGLNRPWFI